MQIWESQYAYDNTCFVYGPFGSGSAYDWYYPNETPIVRLNLNPDATNSVSVKEVNEADFQLYPLAPNPANASTLLQYRLDQNSNVSLEVRDITGKLVTQITRGTQAAGYHSITLDVADYNAGVYMTTLVVNGARATERLLVD